MMKKRVRLGFRHRPHHMQQDGFALVVMAALFVAFSIVAAVMIEKRTATQPIIQQESTRAQLSRISNAIIQYYIFNATSPNHYPCPAPVNVLPDAAGFGISATNCQTGQAIPAGLTSLPNGATAADTYIRGMVPVVTLAPYGVTLEDAFDSWGNRIMYVVDRGLLIGGVGASATRATLTDWRLTGTNAGMIPPDFLTISYGSDRLGAIPRNATAVKIACAVTAGQVRDNNCNGALAFITGPLNVGSTATVATYFDDVVSSYSNTAAGGGCGVWGAFNWGAGQWCP